ncbi:MAG: flagellar basal body-associated FliL family protein [Pseudomonadota bacterium]
MLKFVPFFLLSLGVCAGFFSGLNLRPTETAVQDSAEPKEAEIKEGSDENSTDRIELESEREFVKLNNQFIVPIVFEESVTALVVVSLGLEVASNSTSLVFSAEPKLRDALLQVLFDHANVGGFDAEFTNSRSLAFLREALTAQAQNILGQSVFSVLITDLARQDI